MPKARKKTKHPWYSKKGYLHFDYALTLQEANRYVSNPENITKHKFSPFIHYVKIGRKVQRNRSAEQAWKNNGKPENAKPKLKIKKKPRNIFYASHIDGYIYSYYSKKIQSAYVRCLKENNLDQNIIAYRPIKRGTAKCSNIHFARDAFAFLEQKGNLNVSCFDLSKFFDRLDTTVLKENWAKVLNTPVLSPEYDTLHRQLSSFTYVEEEDLIEHFKLSFADNPRVHGLDPLSGGSKRHRICDYKQLRRLHDDFKRQGKKLIHPKGDLKITGIAQGSAIAGLLSNIFMLEFDIAMKSEVEQIGGLYLRYSDDIFIAYPEISHADMGDRVRRILQGTCGTSVIINGDKTENAVVKKTDGVLQIFAEDGVTPSRIQYLGFHLSSNGVHIRNSSISKDRGKTVQAIAQAHRRKGHGKIDTRSVYKTKSHRQVTSWNPNTDKGFMNYSMRSTTIFDNPDSLKIQYIAVLY